MLTVALLLACAPVEQTFGGLEEPEPAPVDPSDYYAEPVDCPQTVAPGSADGLARWPYVQWVTTDAATVAWGGPIDSEVAQLTAARESAVTLDAEGQDFEGHEDQPFRLYHARLTGLEAGTEYCYAVTVDGETLADGLKLRTAPESVDAPVKFMIIGDYGAGTPEQLEVRDQVLAHAEGVDVLYTTGDNAYGDGTYAEFQANVFEVYQELMTRVVVYPVPGNHDYKTDAAAPYLANFFLPEDAIKAEDKERYYTADWGPIRFIALDDNDPMLEIRTDNDDDEIDWLTGVLEANDRPWPLLALHQPIYSEHETRDPSLFGVLYFQPLIEEYELPLVLQGHNHFYERYPALKGGEVSSLEEGGTVYLTTGGGGRGLYALKDPELREVGIEAHHFILGEVQGCTMTLQAIGVDGEVLDETVLDRCE